MFSDVFRNPALGCLLPVTPDHVPHVLHSDTCEDRKTRKEIHAKREFRWQRTSSSQNNKGWVSPLATFKSSCYTGSPVQKLRFHLHVPSKKEKQGTHKIKDRLRLSGQTTRGQVGGDLGARRRGHSQQCCDDRM